MIKEEDMVMVKKEGDPRRESREDEVHCSMCVGCGRSW